MACYLISGTVWATIQVVHKALKRPFEGLPTVHENNKHPIESTSKVFFFVLL